MKKIFIAAFLLPFSALADFDINSAAVIDFYCYTNTRTAVLSYQPFTFNSPLALDQLDNFLLSRIPSKVVGFRVQSSSLTPSISISLTQNSQAQNYPFKLQDSSGNIAYGSWGLAPNVYKFFTIAYEYTLNSSYPWLADYGNGRYNFLPGDLISDILFSTNSVFRSSILQSLASVNSSLTTLNNNIINLSSFSPSYTASNVLAFADSLSASASQNGFNLDLDKLAFDLDRDHWENSPEGQAAFDSLVNSYGKGLDDLSKLIGMASALNSSNGVDNRYNGLQQLGNAFNGSVDASVNDFKRLSTNWQEGVKQDLQDWRNDVTNRLAHMFDDNIPIDGGNSTPVYVSGQNGGPVSVAGVVRIDQQIPVGVTISAPITIDPTQFNQFSSGWESIVQAVTDFHDYFTSWASNGDIGFGWVRYYSMMYDFSQNTLTNQLAQISLLSSLTNLFANYADNFTNNVIFSISNALAGLTSVSNDYMLLSDYANYINSHGLVDLIDVMDDDTYSALKDELLGISSLDQADSYGRWWRYFTGLQTINANSNYKLANLFIGHEKTLKDLKDSSGSDSLLDKFQQLFELIPSPTDIMDKTGNMTNSIDRSGFASLVDQSSFMSNYFNRVEMFFNRGSSLPANISINLGFGNKPGLQESQPIVLPLDKYRGVMDLLHYGIAFSYCIVNLILLPKFLLILIHLFDRVWKGYDKKLSDAVQA